jgi:hypothetical protein
MRPCVAGNLMSFGDHALDRSSPWLARIVNCALVDVHTGDEESGLCSSSLVLIQHTFSVDVRAVVVCNGDCVWLRAVVDTLSTIWLVTELGTSNVASAASRRKFVGIAARAILELAVGCFTVVTCTRSALVLNKHMPEQLTSLATVALHRATIALSAACTAVVRTAPTIDTALTCRQT